MRTYEVPNDWKELEKEEISEFGRKLISTYGPFSVVIYSRIKEKNLLNINNIDDIDDFLLTLLKFYTKCMNDIATNERSFKSLKNFIELFLPAIKILKLF